MAGDPGSVISEAFERTVRSGPAAFDYALEPRNGGASKLLPAILKTLSKFSEADMRAASGTITATGVMEFEPPRYLMDFGHYAVIGREGREWKGRSGRDLASLRAAPQSHGQPTWLVALAGGVVEAIEQKRPTDDGAERCYDAIADLRRAGARSEMDLALPPRRTLDELARLDVRLCVDDNRLRRVTFTDSYVVVSVELTAFGVKPPSTWDRLPELRTPQP
jgi:hypothetical protein